MESIITSRLVIRGYTKADLNDFNEYMLQRINDYFECYDWYDEDKKEFFLDYRINDPSFLAIERKSDHKVVGNIYLHESEFNSYELGYVINKDYFRQGYAYEACFACTRYLLRHGVHRIFANVSPENKPSYKLLEKLGFIREGKLRSNFSNKVDKEGSPVYWDTYVYGLLESDVK